VKRVSTYWGVVALAAALIWPVKAETCGYHDPSLIARGILNWTYPKALYVGTAVWQAEASGVLPRPRQTPQDLFAYQRMVRHLQTLGEKLRSSRIAQAQGSTFSMVLLDSMLWTRFVAVPEGYAVGVHADGPSAGDVVLVTHGKVIRALEGKESIPKLVPPNPALIAADPATYVNYHRVRIDPKKAEDVDKVVTFTFGDKTVGLHVRRGIAEFLPEPDKYLRKPDVAIAIDGDTWAKLYLNQTDLKSAVENGPTKVTLGDVEEAAVVLDLFDKFEPAKNVTVQNLNLHD
jgi:hypothetical protein